MIQNGKYPGTNTGIIATVDITQGIAIGFNGQPYDGTIGTFENFLGISARHFNAGEVISIYNVFDTQKVKAGSLLFAQGDALTSDATGKFITGAAGNMIYGYATSSIVPTAENDMIDVLILSPYFLNSGGAATNHNTLSGLQGGTLGQYYHLTQPEHTTIRAALLQTITASENINQYDVVTIDGYVADSTDITHRHKVLGIALANILTGNTGLIQTFGEITNAGWSFGGSGNEIYLNGAAPNETAPLSGFVLPLGITKSATTMFIRIQSSILLS